MKHYKEVELVPPALFKVNHIHDSIGFLEKVQSPLVLLPLDKAIGAIVELSHHEAVQVDSQVYHDREVYECTLVCNCGTFEEYEDRLELIHEAR